MATIAVIGDEITVLGMKLAGIEKSAAATPETAQSVYDIVKEEADILAVTHTLFGSITQDPEKITVSIPDMNGGGDTVSEIVKRVVGFEVKSDG
ncbi:MAG: hypothetical protein J7K54_03790 [Candidatus Aenigmarchaeota archaeon]|nr:hypothetical protein [Candidatus Aenigmarchaeota archaeon]